MDSLSDQYVVKALEHYPYNLSEAVESLNYALSYDDENPIALQLMGQVYAEQLRDFSSAIEYYQKSIAADGHNAAVYPLLVSSFIDHGDFEMALKAAKYALTVKGTNKGMIFMLEGFCYEYMEKYKKALASFKKSKAHAFNSGFISYLEGCIKRTKSKMPQKKKTKKSGKTKKRKK